jgi:hypothetical protein
MLASKTDIVAGIIPDTVLDGGASKDIPKKANVSVEKGSMSSQYIGAYELSAVAFVITNLIASSPSGSIFGQKFTSSDPIIFFFRLLLDRKIPAFVRREIIPGNSDTSEYIDLKTAQIDEELVRSCLEFKMATTWTFETADYDSVVTAIAKTTSPDVDSVAHIDDEDDREDEEGDE